MDDLRGRQLNLSSMADEQLPDRKKSQEDASGMSRNINGEPPEFFSNNRTDSVSPPAQPVLIDAEGLQKTLQGLTNMALAHEIALNKDFRLTKPDRSTEPVSPGVQVALDAKEKYWEKVDEILMNKDIKECKDTILDLIHTLKTMLHSTMLPHNVKMRERVDKELDMQDISKQVDNDAFDFVHYMTFILDSLAALCCPIRDQEVVDIRNIHIPSRQVRKAIDLMENMNLDMANFIISQSRNHIVQNCVTYERNKFASFVDLQYRLGNDPIKITREWILRHVAPDRSFNETVANGFLEILEWGDKEWPETLTLDWSRFPPIREEIHRVTVLAAMVASVHEYSRSILVSSHENATISAVNANVNSLDKNQATLLKNFKFLSKLRDELNLLITREEVADDRKLEEALERCCIQAVNVVDQHRISEGAAELDAIQKEKIAGMIRPLIDVNHPVRVLYYRRVKEWLLELFKEDGKGKMQPPQNLSIVGPLIMVPITEMVQLTQYSRAVFDILYKEVFDGNCPPPTFYPPPSPPAMNGHGLTLDADQQNPSTETGENLTTTAAVSQSQSMDPSIAKLIAKLQGQSGENSKTIQQDHLATNGTNN